MTSAQESEEGGEEGALQRRKKEKEGQP